MAFIRATDDRLEFESHTVISQKTAARVSRRLRESGKKLVLTCGCFDILHPGHVQYLQEAKSYGDALIVGINSDESVKRIKGQSRPVQRASARARIVSSLNCVDYVVIFGDRTPIRLIRKIKPRVFVKGGDYKPESLSEYETVIKSGGEVRTTPFFRSDSTTSIIERVGRFSDTSRDRMK